MNRIRDLIHRWRSRWELDGLPSEELDRMLAEVGITQAELAASSDGGEHVARLLPAMLEMNGLDSEEIRRELGLLYRDLQRVCGACHDVRRCAKLMDDGAPLDQLTEICPNAGTMASIAEEHHK